MLRAKQKGVQESWGVTNHSHIRYYFHKELGSQFIHYHYAYLLHIKYEGCVSRLKPRFYRCYMRKPWGNPCSYRLQCGITVTLSVVLNARARGTNQHTGGSLWTPGAQLCCAVTEHWHRLPRGCGVSSLGISQSLLDVTLGTLLWVSLLGQGLQQRDPESPASLSCTTLWLTQGDQAD